LLSANEKMQPVAIHDFDTFSLEGVVVSSIRFHRSNQILSDQ
ncbi:S24 family peptidase, partial [Vibrio anguillarum]